MRGLIPAILVLFCLVAGCGQANLAVLNDVNLFAPKWQEISQQYAFVKRNVGMALPLYQEHLDIMEPKIQKASSRRKPELIGLRNRYQEMMREAEELKVTYGTEYETLKKTVIIFNDWQTRLMKNKLSDAEAETDFATFKVKYREIREKATALQSSLIKNVETHNSLIEAMADLVGDYQSYKIEVR